MRKINESILTKLNESDDSHVSLDKLKELRECLNNVISGMEERGMAEAHCDYNMPQGCDCLSIVGKGYIALTSDTDQDYYFEDLMESVDNDNAEGDPNWYCINCGKKKEDYESAYCDSCWEEEAGMVDKSTIEEPKREFKSFYELQSYKGPWEEAIVVYTPDSFKQEYTEEERSYKFSHDNRFFQPGKIASSIFGNCLDGKDNGVRLDKYTLYKDQGVKPWKVEKIYITK